MKREKENRAVNSEKEKNAYVQSKQSPTRMLRNEIWHMHGQQRKRRICNENIEREESSFVQWEHNSGKSAREECLFAMKTEKDTNVMSWQERNTKMLRIENRDMQSKQSKRRICTENRERVERFYYTLEQTNELTYHCTKYWCIVSVDVTVQVTHMWYWVATISRLLEI